MKKTPIYKEDVEDVLWTILLYIVLALAVVGAITILYKIF